MGRLRRPSYVIRRLSTISNDFSFETKEISYTASRAFMHEKLFKCSASDDQHDRHAHIINNKSIKKILLRKQLTDGLETWYVVLSMRVLQRLHK